jgi:hypothetical protein
VRLAIFLRMGGERGDAGDIGSAGGLLKIGVEM